MDDVSARDPYFAKELEAALDEFYRGDMAEVISLTRGDLTFLVGWQLSNIQIQLGMLSYVHALNREDSGDLRKREKDLDSLIKDQNKILSEFVKKFAPKAAA
jgi:hypothetical protein